MKTWECDKQIFIGTEKGGRSSSGYPPAEGRVEHSQRNSSQENYIIFSLERKKRKKKKGKGIDGKWGEEKKSKKRMGKRAGTGKKWGIIVHRRGRRVERRTESRKKRKRSRKRGMRDRRTEMHHTDCNTQVNSQLLVLTGMFVVVCQIGCTRRVGFICLTVCIADKHQSAITENHTEPT